MLKRSFRLRKYEVERLRRKGESLRSPNFNIKILTNQTNHFRAAIVIPKRIIAKAVERNRLKRKIAEAIAPLNFGNLDIILTLKNKVSEKEIINEMARLKIN